MISYFLHSDAFLVLTRFLIATKIINFFYQIQVPEAMEPQDLHE